MEEDCTISGRCMVHEGDDNLALNVLLCGNARCATIRMH